MAKKRRIPLNNITGVSAGGRAVIDCPVDVRYHKIIARYTTATAGGPTEANMEAELTSWRLKLDGVVQREFSTAQLFDINRTKGKTPKVGATNGYATIFFTEPQRLTHVEREATAWGMQGVEKFQIEVDIAAGAASPALTFFAEVDDLVEPPSGIVKWKRDVITVNATGEVTYRIDPGKGDSIQGILLFEQAAGNIDNVRMTWDGVEMHNLNENVDDEFLATSDFVEVSALVHLAIDGNRPTETLPTMKRLSDGRLVNVNTFLTLTMGAANNVTAIREMMGQAD